MRLFWKLFCSMVIVTVLGCSISGFILIDTQFRTSVQREVEVLYQQNDLLYYLLSTRLQSTASINKEQLDDLLNSAVGSISTHTASFRLCDQTGTALGIGDALPIEAAPLVTQLDHSQRGWELRKVDGSYYLHAASPMPLFGETVYLENYREISGLLMLRDEQYHNYFWVMVMLTIAAIIVSLIVAALILQPLKRLSIAARKIASGKLDERVTVTGDDELSGLSKDFNTMAAQLERQVGELKNEARRQEDFIGSFTHELKTPLTSIIGYAELLRAFPSNQERVLESAGYIFQEGRRLEALSRKLLDMIVLDKQIVFKSVPMQVFLEQVGGVLRPALENEGLYLTVRAEPAELFIDPDLMEMVCLNLLDNARKASDTGSEICLEGFPEGDGYCIQVTDAGRGIPAEDLERVTEAFYMVDKSRARAQGGAGLGLALCRRIVERHGGRIEIESALDKGTTVRVFLKGVDAA